MNTSKICPSCFSNLEGCNGGFVRPRHGVELNADYNGAINILK